MLAVAVVVMLQYRGIVPPVVVTVGWSGEATRWGSPLEIWRALPAAVLPAVLWGGEVAYRRGTRSALTIPRSMAALWVVLNTVLLGMTTTLSAFVLCMTLSWRAGLGWLAGVAPKVVVVGVAATFVSVLTLALVPRLTRDEQGPG
jgi:hypothetical protein